MRVLTHIFSHPDFTVGTGISPVQLTLADFTAGQEFHLALKNNLIINLGEKNVKEIKIKNLNLIRS